MAHPAIDLLMLPFQQKTGGLVIKGSGVPVNGPIVGGMTGFATYPKVFAMRRLSLCECCTQQKVDSTQDPVKFHLVFSLAKPLKNQCTSGGES